MTSERTAGNCFTVAAGFVKSEAPRLLCAASRIPYRKGEAGPFRIVHGTPVGTAGEVLGRRYWHAWVEVDTPSGWVVMDYSNGKEAHLPREVYYEAGQLDEATVWRFTLAEAEQLQRRHRHCGPWVDGWESMADGDVAVVSR
jgi:transglutaminase-like putative cysteine protease